MSRSEPDKPNVVLPGDLVRVEADASISPSATAEEIRRLAEATAKLIAHGKAANTRRSYAGYWSAWCAHCRRVSANPLPADPMVVASWIAALAGEKKSMSTISVAIAAIRDMHEQEGMTPPTSDPIVRSALHGARRLHGRPARPKKAMTIEVLRKISAALRGQDQTERSVRDRALILLGWYAALRRSELAALRWSDLEESEEGLTVTIRRSKTDQAGAGKVKGLPYQPDPVLCAIRAIQRWRKVLAVRRGRDPLPDEPVFVSIHRGIYGNEPLTGKWVAKTVKNAILRIGMDPKIYSGHSLRRGFATEAARRGKRLEQIQRHMGHSAISTTARYVEEGTRFDESNPTHGLS